MKNLTITIILVCVTLLSAEQIAVYNTPSSEYCVRIIDNDGDVWDKDANSFTISGYTDPNGFIDLTEDSKTPGRYYTTFPPEISAGTYDVLVYDNSVATIDATADYDGGFSYDWDGTAEQTLSDFTLTSGAVQADMVRINGELTSGNNATLSLKQLDITNDTSSAVVLDSPQWGLSIIGSGGVDIEGTSAAGLQITGITDDISVDNDGDSYDLADYLKTIYSKLPSGNFFDVLNHPVLLPHTTEAQIDNIEADTNELQTDDVPGLIAGLNDPTLADINAEVDTALEDYNSPTYQEVSDMNDVLKALIEDIPVVPGVPGF